MTRPEHVAWCKHRALEYLDSGEAQMAVTSMLSDLRKHPETERLAANIGMMALMAAASHDAGEIRKFIEGFN